MDTNSNKHLSNLGIQNKYTSNKIKVAQSNNNNNISKSDTIFKRKSRKLSDNSRNQTPDNNKTKKINQKDFKTEYVHTIVLKGIPKK